ncbi:hypothetical protein VTO73DRAFT_5999 [Trametes versicolor]
MPLHLAIVRQASKKLVTRLKSGTTMRSIGRSFSRIPLSPFITVVQATGNVGSSVPFLHGISSVVATILQRAEAVKRNYEECEEIADLAKGVELAVKAAIGDAPEDELDEKTKEHIAELEEQRMASYTYLDTPNANLVCCICRTCLHTFCYECISQAISINCHCPIDRTPLSLHDLAPADPVIRNVCLSHNSIVAMEY